MTNQTKDIGSWTQDEFKETLALHVLISNTVMDINTELTVPKRDFLRNLIMSFHNVDVKAVLGAQHVQDFLEEHSVDSREFNILADVCDCKVHNFVILMRGVQLGMLASEEITNLFWENSPTFGASNPFDFEGLGARIEERGIKLNRI